MHGKHDFWSVMVIGATFVLFVAALFVKGFTHDILLEAAVFLVSVKLIRMSFKNSQYIDGLNRKLDDLRRLIEGMKKGGE